MSTRSLCAAFVAALCGSLSAQSPSPFATSVVNFQQGTGSGVFVQQNILGGPLGAGFSSGSLDVLTLGEGGSVVLGFDVAIQDRPGADLAVFENGFGGSFGVFAEVAWVEVSTDGVSFARFPSVWNPPASGPNTTMGSFANLAGGMPVMANVNNDAESPFNPVHSGGEALDLQALASDPLVLGGQVDLQAVHFVRLVDVKPGETDSLGAAIGAGTSGGADIDAVAALHHDGQPAGGAVCDLSLDASGALVLQLGDTNGFGALDPATLQASISPIQDLPFAALFSVLTVTGYDGKVGTLSTLAPVTGAGFTLPLAVSVRDDAGAICGDQLMVQD